jgi:hypothetical protein
LAVLVFAEAAALLALTVYLVVELFLERPQSYGSAVSILALSAFAGAWLVVVAVSVLRGRPWVRAAVVVWQVLQIGVGVGSLQGLLPRQDIGWLLIVPALAALALVFTRSVTAATTQGEPAGSEPSGDGAPGDDVR